MKNLPDKPSALIHLALHDLEEVEQMPAFGVQMSVWLNNYNSTDRCLVCFAGAVMVRSLYEASNRSELPAGATPGAFESDDTRRKLIALDCLRDGAVDDGLAVMHIKSRKSWGYRTITSYHADPAEFKAGMRKLAQDFENEGL